MTNSGEDSDYKGLSAPNGKPMKSHFVGLSPAATLSRKQVFELLSSFTQDEIVLVGGQAVLLYADAYAIEDIELGVSGDIDFIGMAIDAKQCFEALQGEKTLKIATLDDIGIHTGLVCLRINDREYCQFDFLSGVAGLNTLEIQERSVQISYGDAGKKIPIIHPFHLLESKIHNLLAIPSKRDIDGIRQARLSIRIAEIFLDDVIRKDPKKGLRGAEKLFKISCTQAALFSELAFGLKAFDAVPREIHGIPEYSGTRYPQMQEYRSSRLEKVRALYRDFPESPSHSQGPTFP